MNNKDNSVKSQAVTTNLVNSNEITAQSIQNLIISLPNRPPAMLAKDLAEIYETETSHINRAVDRNIERFPVDFRFQATNEETNVLVCQSVITKESSLKSNPYLFTREGANMLSAVLHTDIAIQRSIQIMRAFSAIENRINKPPAFLPDFTNPAIAARAWADELEAKVKALSEVKQLSDKVEADKPKVVFAEAVSVSNSSILINDLAKLIKQNGIDIGGNRLFEYLRETNYLCKEGRQKNKPTQKAMDLGLFKVKETVVITSSDNPIVRFTPLVTGKGQQYFINKFLKAKEMIKSTNNRSCKELVEA